MNAANEEEKLSLTDMQNSWSKEYETSMGGMLLPLDVNQLVEVTRKIAELASQTTPQVIEAVRKAVEMFTHSLPLHGKGVENILDGVKASSALFAFLRPFSGIERKRNLLLFNLLLIFSLILAACAGSAQAGTSTTPEKTPVITTISGKPTEQSNGKETPTAPALSSLEIDYGRYASNEAGANAALTSRWQEIASSILAKNLVLPGNVLVVDISANDALLEALPQNRPDDYAPGTTFTVSHVQNHEGEVLTVTVDGANQVLGSARAVGLAIGINELPVALDKNDAVVAYVNSETGHWTVGSISLAPEVVTGVAQTTATPESGELHFEVPPMTLDNIQIPEVVKNQFPIETTTRPDGSISRQVMCVSDGLYVGRIQLSEHIHAFVSAECWYEENGAKKSFYLPLAWTDGKTEYIAGYKADSYDPSLETADEAFWMSFLGQAGYKGNGHIFVVSAEQIDPSLGVYGTFQGVGADELSKIFTEQLFAEFGSSGNPDTLGDVIVSPDVGMVNTRNN